MDKLVDEERLNEYQNRVSEWIGAQGIFFQLRYAGIVGNYSLAKQFGNYMAKLVIFLVALVGIGYFLLNRHFGAESYREKLSGQMSEALGSEEIEISGFMRSRGQGTFQEVELTGGKESFFIEGQVKNLTGPIKFLAGVSERWKPDVLNISQASFQLKAGGAEEEMEMAFQGLLETFKEKHLKVVTVESLSVDWGYSKLTYGAIEETLFKANLVDDTWEVSLTGGKFSQNWLQRFELVEAKIEVTATGVKVKSLNLKLKEGTVNLSGFIGGTLGLPELDLSGKMSGLPVEDIIQLPGLRVRDYVAGTISGELAITGSTNRRIETAGKVILEADDMITIREKWELLKTMTVLDINQSYRRVDFTEGQFEFKTSRGDLEINGLRLRASNLMQLRGAFESSLPSQKEAAESLGITLTTGFGTEMTPDLTDTSSAQSLENERMTLRRVAGGAKVNDFNLELETSSEPNNGQGLSVNSLEEQRLRYEMNVHRIKGQMSFGIGMNSVRKYPSLQKLYPADAEGWRWIPLAFQTTFSNIGELEALRLLQDSRINLKDLNGSGQ